MGNQKQKWTYEEEEALKAGVNKHGTGKWKNILKDPEFAPYLTSRSNIDLKDKWRNMSISTGQITKDKSKVPRGKPVTAGGITIGQSPYTAIVLEDDIIDDSSKSPQDSKSAPRYNTMIFEALSSMNSPMGSDIGAIVGFIEQRHEVPQNFRRLLGSKLRRLVLQGKLEKVENGGYRIKDAASGTRAPVAKPRDVRARPSQSCGPKVPTETVEDASKTAAYRIADAENKSFVAAVAVGEAERVSHMADEMESILHVIKEMWDDCARGETFLVTL